MIAYSANPQSPAAMSSIDSVFNSWFEPGKPCGSVLIAKDHNVIYKKGFGIEDIETQIPITPQTLFNTGSISKTFVAYGILKLAAEGRISLDDDLYKYFPDFKSPGIARQVKIHHLLTHSSGLPDSRRVTEEHDFYLTAKDEENFAPLKETSQLLFEPGTRYRYSNPAFNGLALVIQKVAGEKWQHYIKRTIFDPAGMNTSTITDGPHPESGVSHAYILNAAGDFEELDYGEEPTFAAAGNGGVWSTVEELWRYEQAIRKNLFLDKKWTDLSRTIYPLNGWTDSIPQRLGLSWFLTKESGLDMIGHTGSQGGFISDYLWLPSKKIFYILLCNIPKPIKEIRAGLVDILEKQNWLD
ncbi:MAG TPA: serine hydrolase domain-containing protein [Chitinophagaceae bacterium]|nr:serine hydrolase domain-containing protein [Chitinophagaceae bacterium]